MMVPGHAGMLGSSLQKNTMAPAIGHINSKSTIHLACNYLIEEKDSTGAHSWAHGYHVSFVGRK